MTQATTPSIDTEVSSQPAIAIATNVDQLTVDWFRAVLDRAGLLTDAGLSAVELEPVGGGLIARMVRATFTYDGPTTAPRSVVVKFPTDDPGSLGLALAMGMYELETRFYQDIAPMVPEMGTPTCYFAQLSADAATFNLVLEDLSAELRPGDVLTASTLEECARGLGELVKFQSPLWNSDVLSKLEWLADPRRTIGVFDALPAGLEPFLARFGDYLDPKHVALFESVVPRAGEWVRGWTAPTVVQHGDFRSDNLMFATDPDSDRVGVIDFQTVRLGPPGLDAAYFLGSSLPTAERRASERALIKDYHQRLVDAGVEGFDFDQCWASYREGAMYAVFLFVGMASQVESTERGDRVIVDQIKRYADMALDLEAPQAAGLL
ncbi:phosphotransferase [Mycobacterium sp. CVI_P3]|uniref:Phosphotransferase n=1 Tax=Mycobacterium pinniadriaticum TaxID=2994102 RepID=A0ABT3SP00_9MYCO|nr:phosphotransferase [Mycobacterium pinniadriaticum]MCX2934480.1 phosphotransferase [Mycobacterium pinniadriaticum]MCX2940903.1 phosphotransferase [Mycobacterium pinniadriaticum]